MDSPAKPLIAPPGDPKLPLLHPSPALRLLLVMDYGGGRWRVVEGREPVVQESGVKDEKLASLQTSLICKSRH